MISLKHRSNVKLEKIEKAVDKAAFKNFGHGAASISKDAKSSIRRGKKASAEGEPPRTRRGLIRRAIRFAADKEGAVIGPRKSIVGEAGKAHEFGGEYKGQNFVERPFMHPALARGAPRFAGEWKGSVGE